MEKIEKDVLELSLNSWYMDDWILGTREDRAHANLRKAVEIIKKEGLERGVQLSTTNYTPSPKSLMWTLSTSNIQEDPLGCGIP